MLSKVGSVYYPYMQYSYCSTILFTVPRACSRTYQVYHQVYYRLPGYQCLLFRSHFGTACSVIFWPNSGAIRVYFWRYAGAIFCRAWTRALPGYTYIYIYIYIYMYPPNGTIGTIDNDHAYRSGTVTVITLRAAFSRI